MDWVALARTLATEATRGSSTRPASLISAMWRGWRPPCAATMTPKWWPGCMTWPRTARRLPRGSRYFQPLREAVQLLNRDAAPDADSYYARIAAHPLALKVKRADLDDNADPQRLAMLDGTTAGRLRDKYAHARAALGI